MSSRGQEVVTRVVGRIVATERKPNTPHQFHFWTELNSPVGIGAIVRVSGDNKVNGESPTIYGVVTEGLSYTERESAIESSVSQIASHAAAAGNYGEMRLYTAAVLRTIPEEPLQPVPMGDVFMATADEVNIALRMDSYLKDGSNSGIPVGLYRAGGTEAPIYLDADFLIGPEAAHLNVTGMSGLATKTSAIEWLLASLFRHFPKERGSIAAVCFNVKGPDLCFLDQPGEVSDEDKAMYDLMGVPAEPFKQTHYFAPYTAKGITLNTLRSHDSLMHNVSPLTWGLREVLEYTEVLLTKDDVDAKADALIDFIAENVVNMSFSDAILSETHEVRSFADLDAWFKDLLKGMERTNTQQWRTHHVATVRKVRNRLLNISTRCAGLVTDSGHVSDLPFGDFKDRDLYVVDVANLEEDAQDLVFSRIVSKLREHLERRDLGVKHLVVFVDELNKYAPNDGDDTFVRKMLLDIAERGRYLGLVLFSAQQFRSQVHRRVVGNSGTSLFGRTDADELTTPGYYVLSAATRTKLATLEKGQLMVRHPHFTQPIFVHFPRPAVMRGRDGADLYPQATDVTLEVAVYRSLRALDPSISYNAIADIVASHQELDVLRARNATLQERPADVLGFFRSRLRKINVKSAEGSPQVVPVQSMSSENPYGF